MRSMVGTVASLVRISIMSETARYAVPATYTTHLEAEAGGLTVVQSSKFELIINARTAQMLRLNVPPSLLAIADEVIE